jgi:hypothetical protein
MCEITPNDIPSTRLQNKNERTEVSPMNNLEQGLLACHVLQNRSDVVRRLMGAINTFGDEGD